MSKTYRRPYFSFSARRELVAGGAVFMSLGFVACGDKAQPIGGEDDAGQSSSTSASTSGSASNVTQSTTTAANVSSGGNVNPTTTKPPSDAGDGVSTVNDAGSSTSACGGAGQACCARSTCDDGFVCIAESAPALEDAGIVVFDGGRNNQAFFDGGQIDASLDAAPGTEPSDSDASGQLSEEPAGICAPCGGEDERCCAQDTCGAGLSCESSGFGPNASSSCIDDGCGATGQQCCPGNGGPGNDGQCDDGLSCDNPPGDMLEDSECEPEVASDDGGAGQDAGESTSAADAASECGGLDQACCPGGGGQCDDGLECDRRPPAGLEGNVCVED